jgi:hypothetical protein
MGRNALLNLFQIPVARIAASARARRQTARKDLMGGVSDVDRRLRVWLHSVVFVKEKRTVGRAAVGRRGHAAASGCAAGVPVMKTAEAG